MKTATPLHTVVTALEQMSCRDLVNAGLTKQQIAEARGALSGPAQDGVERLREKLGDAIEDAYCAPVRPPVEGEDPATVRGLARSAVVADPDRMRHLAGITKAAWEIVAPAPDVERLGGEEGQCPCHAGREAAMVEASPGAWCDPFPGDLAQPYKRSGYEVRGYLPRPTAENQPASPSEEGLTSGDIGGLLEAIDCRLGGPDPLKNGQVRRYGEIRAKLSAAVASRQLDALLTDEPASPSPVEEGDWPEITLVRAVPRSASNYTRAYIDEEPPLRERFDPELYEVRRYVPATSDQEAGEVEG